MALNIESDFLLKGKDIEDRVSNVLSLVDGKITTITCFMATDSNLNIDRILTLYKNTDAWSVFSTEIGKDINIRLPGSRKNSKRAHKAFFNSISVWYKEGKRKICTKIFRTGFHITGCNTFEDCLKTFRVMVKLVEKSHGVTVALLGHKIQMVNILADFDKELDLENLSAYYIERGLNCKHDREKYCGLRVKNQKEEKDVSGTALLFPSGKAMLTGLKCACDFDVMIRDVIAPLLVDMLDFTL